MKKRSSTLRFLTVFAVSALLGSCVDAPLTPADGMMPGPLAIAPNLTLVGPGGQPVSSVAQADALTEAFDRVDRFRMVVRRSTTNAVVVDTVIQVTPGQSEYDLSVSVTPNSSDEQFEVTLTALEGEVELFQAPPITVKATPQNQTSSAPPAAVNVTLSYSGPGAEASAVQIDPAGVAMGPGGTAALSYRVLDDEGNELADVPVSWTSENEAVATIADGIVTGVADGIATVVVATPTGLLSSATIFVVEGTLAYVEGGAVKVRGAGGGEAQARTGTVSASAPAWAPNGGLLYYASGGSARLAGDGSALVSGDWPSVSPDGSYLAVERGGQVVFANADGSREREGPSGTTPVWSDGGTVVVGGGSIQQVNVVDGSRSTLVTGRAALPALGPGGALAYVSGSELKTGQATLAEDASGRPSWSVNGRWLAYQGSGGIMVVPVDGSAGALPLPGLEAASDPAWQPSSPMGAPSAPFLTGLNPDPPVPGNAVNILGGGFDLVIPANNSVSWPTPNGREVTEITQVTSGSITTVMPRRVSAGQIRVENRAGAATLDFVPRLGALEVHAHTPWDTPVPGVEVILLNASNAEVARIAVDDQGMLLLPGLTPGTYTVQYAAPSGFVFVTQASQSVEITTETLAIEVVLRPGIANVRVDPADPQFIVGEDVDVVITPVDVNGNPIPEFDARWISITPDIAVSGTGELGVLTGIGPSSREGGSEWGVWLDGQLYVRTATITTSITGVINLKTDDGEVPAPPQQVALEQDGKEIARTDINTGEYGFSGLYAGTYTVRPDKPAEGNISPESTVLAIDHNRPSPTANFTITRGAKGEVIVVGDMNYWGPGYFNPFDGNDNRKWTANLATNGNSTRVVWYRGHASRIDQANYGTLQEWFKPAADVITKDLDFTLDVIEGTTTGGLKIPRDAGSFWIWLPRASFDASDVAEIQSYLAAGGRIILVGELGSSSWWSPANAIVQQLMTSLGSGAVYNEGCSSGTTTELASDPLFNSVTSIEPTCTSSFTPGTGDATLVTLSGKSVVIRLGAGSKVASLVKHTVSTETASVSTSSASETDDRDGTRGGSSNIRSPRRH